MSLRFGEICEADESFFGGAVESFGGDVMKCLDLGRWELIEGKGLGLFYRSERSGLRGAEGGGGDLFLSCLLDVIEISCVFHAGNAHPFLRKVL